MLTVYGLKNCDTCRKAMKWLAAEGVEARLHDVRADGLMAETVAAWAGEVGLDVLLNRRGTTWRQLADADKNRDEAGLIALMAEQPALIKRPVFDLGDRRLVGFAKAQQEELAAAVR